MRTLNQCLLAVAVTRRSMGSTIGTDDQSDKKPNDFCWVVTSMSLPFLPGPDDAIPFGDFLMSPSCLTVETRIAFVTEDSPTDAILVCHPFGDAVGSETLGDDDVVAQLVERKVPSMVVNDAGIYNRLAVAGFVDLERGSNEGDQVWLHLRTRFPGVRLV